MADVKVKINETPSADVVAKQNQSFVVTDAKGRAITLKKPGVLSQFRLIEALGDTAKNQVYTSMVLPIIFVTDIDGDPIPQPQSKREIEALIQRLDDEGIEAVSNGVMANFGASTVDADKEALKNS
jgi:hypothetical protein